MIPTALQSLDQWLCWTLVEGRKIPVIAATGFNASSTDPSTWCSYAMARDCASAYTGIGFVFTKDDGLVGIDLDSCLTEGGELEPWARPILAMFPTYAEVSPSGRGIKLFLRGSLPPTARKKWYPLGKPQAGERHAPAVEVYSEGRFFTVTGEHWPGNPTSVNDCQEALDFLIAAHFTAPAYVRRTSYERNGTDAAFRRAEAYVATIPGAVAGQNGHTTTFNVACHLVQGFGLDYDDAMSILADWNSTCDPPWEDRDLERKVMQAMTASTRSRGYLLGDDRPDPMANVDLSGLEVRPPNPTEQPAEQSTAETAPPFPESCLEIGGTIGRIMEHTLRNSIYPQPELALAGALALMSTITGRKIEDRWRLRTNAYYLGLCDAGGGKNDARKTNSRILTALGETDLLAPTKIKSSSGVVSILEHSPACLFQLDEVNRLLQSMKDPRTSPHLYDVGSVFLEFYGESNNPGLKAGAYADRTKNPVIAYPHLVVYGVAVGAEFWTSLTKSNLSDGLLGRMMPFEGRSGVRSEDPEMEEPSEVLLYEVGAWTQLGESRKMVQANNPPECRRIDHTEEAWARYRDHGRAIELPRLGESKTAAGLWRRTAEKTGKLAMLAACSRVPLIDGAWPVIELCDVEWAIKLSNWLTRNVLVRAGLYVSESTHESNLIRLLRELDGWKSRQQICRDMRWLKARDRDDLIRYAVADGFIEERKVSTSTRPSVEYRRVGKVSV